MQNQVLAFFVNKNSGFFCERGVGGKAVTFYSTLTALNISILTMESKGFLKLKSL